MAQTNNLSALTELEAINAMLASIGEAPVSTLIGATQADVVTGINILRNQTREVQSWGWRFNTDFGLEVLPSGTFAWTDSAGVTTTLNVFRPPAQLAAFEMAMGPTQQGSSYADAVLRPAPITVIAPVPVVDTCVDCLSPQVDGVASSGLSGFKAVESNGMSDEDFSAYLVSQYATYLADHSAATHGFRDQSVYTAETRNQIVQLAVNGGHRAIRGTRTSADVAAHALDPINGAKFGPSWNKPIASNGFLVAIPDLWHRIRFQFSPGYVFGGIDRSVLPSVGRIDGKFYITAVWSTTGAITECWQTQGNLVGIISSEAEDRLRADGVPHIYLEIQAAGYGDRLFPLMPCSQLAVGEAKEFSIRVKRGLVDTKTLRVQVYYGDAFGTPEKIWDTEAVGVNDWSFLYHSMMVSNYEREDMPVGMDQKCYDIIEWETIRGLDYNNPFGYLPVPSLTTVGLPIDYMPDGDSSYTGITPGELVFYDRVRNRHGFDPDERSVLYIDAQWAFGFEEIPYTARAYIMIRAVRQFCQQVPGSAELAGFTAQDEQQALRALKRDQGETDDYNIMDNMSVSRTLGMRPGGYSGVYDPRSEAGKAR